MALASPGTFWACQIFFCLHISVTRWRRCTHQLCSGSFSDPELQQMIILRSRTPTNDRSDFQNARLAQVAHSLARHPTYWNSIRAEQDSPAVGAAAEVLPNSDNVSLWTVFSEDDSPVAKKNKSLTVSVGQPQARSRNSISPSSGHKDLTPVDQLIITLMY